MRGIIVRTRRSIVVVALAGVVAGVMTLGCQQPRQQGPTNVVMHTTTQPAGGEPGRRVDVFVQEPRPAQGAGGAASAGGAGAGVGGIDGGTGRGTSSASAIVGRMCRIQFRRDALGMASPTPLSPTMTQAGAGRGVAIEGRVGELTRDAVMLESEGKTMWIPMSSVLMIERID